MTRGKKDLNERHMFLLRKVREARAALDTVDDEIAYRVEELTKTLRADAETEARVQVWAALDSGIPMSDVKAALKIKNHDTFKKRWLNAYIAPPALDFDGSWFLVGEAQDGWYPVLLAYDQSTPLYVRPGESLEAPTWREDSLLVIQENPELPKWVEDQDKNQGELLRAIYEKKED